MGLQPVDPDVIRNAVPLEALSAFEEVLLALLGDFLRASVPASRFDFLAGKFLKMVVHCHTDLDQPRIL